MSKCSLSAGLKPLLKWVGGKAKQLDKIMYRLPTRANNYHEPFVGGGSVLFAIISAIETGDIDIKGKVYASDLNEDLIQFYKCIQTCPNELAAVLEGIRSEYGSCQTFNGNKKPADKVEGLTSKESYYYWIRSVYNMMDKTDVENQVLASAMFLFLNKTCFRGLHRVGPNGFNVPFGNYKTLPAFPNLDELLVYSSALSNVEFVCQSYEKALLLVKKGDMVYLDPPYAPVDVTSFVQYNKEGFSEEEHMKLFDMVKSLKKKNISCVMSNADVAMVRDAFVGWDMETIVARRAINSKSPDATQSELILY